MRRIKQLKTVFILMIAGVMALIMPNQLFAGSLEPPGPPASTMKTMDHVTTPWNQILSVSKRFENALGGNAVLDKETGLVWAKDANLAMTSGYDADGRLTWQMAIDYCRTVTIDNRKGWRLPTIDELSSLIDMSQSGSPKVPSGVFNNVQSTNYYSSTTYEDNSILAWGVHVNNGNANILDKADPFYVWPVRGGND